MARISIYPTLMILAIVFVMNTYAGDNTVGGNNMNVIHKETSETTVAFPDECKTPAPGGPIPIPYPNISKSSDTAKGTKKVKMDGNPVMLKGSNFTKSEGDEPGTEGNPITNEGEN